MKNLSKKSSVINGCLFLLALLAACTVTPALAESTGSAALLFPRDTEALFTLKLAEGSETPFPADLLQKTRNFITLSRYLDDFQKKIDFDITNDFFPWQKGIIHLAAVKTGDESPVARMCLQSLALGDLTLCKIHLHELSRALDRIYEESGKYPPSLEGRKMGEFYEMPKFPAGWELSYSPAADGRSYTLVLEMKAPGHGGTRIVCTPEKGLTVEEQGTRDQRIVSNIIAVIPIKNHDLARAFLSKVISRFTTRESVSFEESTYKGFELFAPRSRITGSFALNRNYMLISDNVEVLKSVIDTINGKGASLKENARYLSHARRMPDTAVTLSLFVDFLSINQGSPVSLSRDAALMEILRSCESLWLWSSIRKKEIKGEASLMLVPGKISRNIETFLHASGESNLSTLLARFPSNISTFTAVQVFDLLSLFGSLDMPGKKGDLNSVIDAMTLKSLGLSWKDEIKPAITGHAGISYEIGEIMIDSLFRKLNIDQKSKNYQECCNNLSNMAIAMDIYRIDHSKKLPVSLDDLVPDYLQALPRCPAGGGYLFEPQPDGGYLIKCHSDAHKSSGIKGDNPCYSSSEGIVESDEKSQGGASLLPMVPFLAGFQVLDARRADSIVQKLLKKRGAFHLKDYKERKVFVSEDETCAYALLDNYLFIEMGGKVPNKLQKTIDAFINSRNSLHHGKSFKSFETRLQGTPVFIRYEKIDWVTSLLKSFLLLAGYDFREWAAMIGEYEDSWTALTLREREVRLLFEVSGP
ncbi:MAG: DUF3352 domain-containing protein [Candidatus Eremiobacteraeota bacterium]|nr:DUF3352 domain-containing protein [Candidatus Eremiobacteraeota bacterium]